jgi:hypothetical protein
MIALGVALTIVIVASEVDGRARSHGGRFGPRDRRVARPTNEKERNRPVGLPELDEGVIVEARTRHDHRRAGALGFVFPLEGVERPVRGGPRRGLPVRLPGPRVLLGLSHVRPCDED